MIKFITGRQTDPLQDKILEQAVKNYKENPESETFIIIPNHIKFTTEVRAINKLAVSNNQTEASVKNLQVLSFSRLAWFFLKNEEQGLPTQLDDAASAMLLEKIIDHHRDELELFKNVNVNTGLVKQVYQTILQIHDGNLDLDEIDEENLNSETKSKIHDLRIIYEAFLEEIAGKFSTKNEVQLQLNDLLARNKEMLKDKTFYFSDFSHFSLQESLTIKLLMKYAKNVTLAFKTKNGEINANSEVGDYDYVIQQTIGRLIQYLQREEIDYSIEQEKISPIQSERELLNEVWSETIPPTNELKQVQLVKADSRYAEAYFVAHTIYQQVALSNYRYQDFLILAPNLHEYETYLTPILRQNKIPFFNDLQQEMKYHPLVVLIENLANLLANPYQTQNIITILKTRLLIPDWYKDEQAYIHDVDELENFVLAHGINHNLWKRSLENFVDAATIKLDKMPEEVANIDKLRQFIVKQISQLMDKIQQEKDSQKAITIFFNFLTQNGVATRLENWREKAQEEGDLQQAQQPEQVWDLLITLLKDYLLINLDNFDANRFFEMLISGFREASFSQIPSTLDAVNISEMGMIQTSGYKQVFIIGATSGNIPAIQKMPAFLSTENLDELAQVFGEDSYIEDNQQLNNLDQNYQFGMSLALAQDKVYISYPILNASNEELEPSLYYETLKSYGASEMQQHDLPEKIQDTLSFITNAESSLGYLSYLNSTLSSKAISELLTLTKEKIPHETESVLEASEFDNNPHNIGADLAQELYGQNLNASVSQLETFYENSYEYFLNYGLRLRRRAENEFDVIQAGNYFHETFDRLVKELKRKHLDLAEIDNLELEKLLAEARQAMQEESKYSQLMNDPFNKYLFKCLDHTTSKVARNWHRTVKNTPLRAQYSELSFGLGEKVKGLNFEVPDLSGKHNVNLRGKMDRVDLAPIDKQNVLAQVIDYKSSEKKFDLGMFYNGLSLQMVSYLDVLAKNGQFFAGKDDLKLLGAFYQTITRQVEKLNGSKLIDSKLHVKDQLLDTKDKLMYKGLINNDPDLLLEADPLLEKDDSSIYYGVKPKKNGFTLPRNVNFNQDEIDLLLRYDEYLIKEASNKILSGQIELNPYRKGNNQNALTYSDYRDIFFFDAMLKENQYHDIDSLQKKQLMTKIKEILDEKEEDE